MSAPKTKSTASDDGVKKGIQLIVFAPINADSNDEENRIYMVCPSSLKVVEVIEKFGEEADQYLALLGKHKKKSATPPSEFSDDVDSIDEISDDLIEDNSGSVNLSESTGKSLKGIESELDEDLITFASESLGDIFPEEGEGSPKSNYSDTDLADALALLDEEDDESALSQFGDFKSDEDESLPEL